VKVDLLIGGTAQKTAIAVAGGRIVWFGPEQDWNGEAAGAYDCGGRAVIPALVDPHTHLVWMGDRLADFEARACGVGYEEILARGGGIRSTIRKTAAATREELVSEARPRVAALVRSGAATIEVKSGYGFTAEAEIRMLEAIADLAVETPARLIPTLLIHIPPVDSSDRAAYLDEVRSVLIPEVARRGLATAVDVFVEKEAWSAAEAEGFIRAARAFGLPAKLHTEQFHRVGGLERGMRERVLSVDHLEACSAEQLPMLARGSTVATILPGVSLHLGIPAAPGRALIDAGATVAVGTDLNPGSSPLYSTSAALGLAVRLNGLTPAEALTAGTVNAAAALGLNDRGKLAAGYRADFLVLAGSDWRDIVYAMGTNVVSEVWIGGKRACG
jgi:imidazolonepropionase